MTTTLHKVRYQGQSGKHLLAASFSGFDPSETSDLIVPFAGGFTFTARSQRVRLLELD
jgi:hypothetical protein